MGGLDTIDSVENMEDELRKDELLRWDVSNLVFFITPYIPHIGFLSSQIMVLRHMYNKTTQTNEKKSVQNQENGITKGQTNDPKPM